MNLAQTITTLAPSPVLSLAAALLLFFAAEGIGRRLLRAYGFFALNTTLGLVVIAVAALLPSPFRVTALPQIVLWILLALPAAYSLYCNFPVFLSRRRLTLVTLAIAAATLAPALLPPHRWDELVYQAVLPIRYAADNSVAVRMDNPFSAFPSLQHFSILPLVPSGGVLLPRLLCWLLMSSLVPVLFLELRRRRLDPLPAGIFTAATLLSPAAILFWSAAYAESWLTFLLASGFLAATRLRRHPVLAPLLTGVAAGAMIAVKPTGGGAALALGIYLMMVMRPRREILWFPAAALAVAFPFFLRVYIGTGNPFYPWGGEWFGATGSALAVEAFHRELGGAHYGVGGWLGVMTGWLTAALPLAANDGISLGLQMPLLVILALWCALRYRSRSRTALLVAVGVTYLFWAFTARQPRFLYPAFILLTPAAASGWRRVAASRIRILLLIIIAGVTVAQLDWPQLRNFYYSWRVLPASRRVPDGYLAMATRDPGYVRLAEELNRRVSPDERVLLLGERRTLYLKPNVKIGTPGFQEFLTPPPADVATLSELLSGFDWIVLAPPMTNPDRVATEDEALTRLAGQLGELVAGGRLELSSGDGFYIFKVIR